MIRPLREDHPPDPDYRRRYAADAIGGFRMLSLILCATMAAMSLVHVIERGGSPSGRPEASLSFLTSAVLAVAGAAGLSVSRRIRGPAAAFVAAAVLLGAAVAAIANDQLRLAARTGGPTPSLIPVIFVMLMLGTALMPLRPAHTVALGLLLLFACAAAAAFWRVPLRGSLMDYAIACASIVVSAAISARSTSQRIRLHQAHLAAMDAARHTEQARLRAVLAESAVTMERLAASLSHELNSPIGALKSATETLTLGVRKHASFPAGSPMPRLVEELSDAITQSAARLKETVTRIQRFANLDRGGIRLTDVNQLVQDAVALMNPPSAGQAQVILNLNPLSQIWCRPHALSAALASVLNTVLECGRPVVIETQAVQTDVKVEVTVAGSAAQQEPPDLGFGVVAGRVRATGWDLFAARQLVRQTGGDLQTGHASPDRQTITITIPGTVESMRLRVLEAKDRNAA